MWFLIPKEVLDDRLHLPVGKELIVGRVDGHVTIDERSVSRKQAILMVKSTKVRDETEFHVTIRDTSRFGSYVNGEKIVQEERQLSEGDTICFGIPTGIQFSLSQEKLVVCGSTISTSVKASLVKTLNFLGGVLVSEWSRKCSLLVISRVSITMKVINALIQGCPIVTPEYIFQLHDHLTGKRSTSPQATDFQPVVTQESQHLENTEIDLLPRSERRELFKDETFIFMSKKRYERLVQPLESGGGRCLLWESQDDFHKDEGEKLVPKSIVFYEESAVSWQRKIYDILKKHRRRPIVDAEIGYAVLACSTEEYCNVTKRCDLLSRHGIPNINFSQLPSGMSQSLCESSKRESRKSFSILDETPMTSETPEKEVQHARKEPENFHIKEEVHSEIEYKPNVLVPQTPPTATAPDADVTNVTTVPCSLELKTEEPWSEEATELPEPEQEEDPFDRIPLRKKRRRAGNDERESNVDSSTSCKSPAKVPRRKTTPAKEAREQASIRQQEAPVQHSVQEEAMDEPSSHVEEAEEQISRREEGESQRHINVRESKEHKRKRDEDVEETFCIRDTKRQVTEQSMTPGEGKQEDSDSLPRNCTDVKTVSLMRKKRPPVPSSFCGDGPNFKKFRKTGHSTSNTSHRRTVILVVNARAELEPDEENDPPISQNERNTLDSQADELFEEMRRVHPKNRR